MALYIKNDGRILCAALNKIDFGDVYIDDDLHYQMSVVHKVIVTHPEPKHTETGGQWWWRGQQPEAIELAPHIESAPGVRFGVPVIQGTRTEPWAVYGMYKAGDTADLLAAVWDYPIEKIKAAIEWAKHEEE